VLQTTGDKVNVAKNEVEQITPSKQSAMPAGLFNKLSQDEIADLFAYLEKAAGPGASEQKAAGGE
jgi:mono/diheme cytochrome c family protein